MQARAIRRKDRQISHEECLELLRTGEYGVLATADAEGQPYAVPLSYVLMNGKIYFHCAHEGHKIDNLKQNPRVSLVVVGFTEPVYDKGFSTYFESVVVFGRVDEILDEAEKNDSLTALAKKYLPHDLDKLEENLNHYRLRTAVYALSPEIITGKAKKKKPAAG